VQGGMLATLADLGLGRAARLDIPGRRQATIQISVQYIDAARIGEFLVARCRKLKETRNLVFVAGEIEADGRLVASVSGIWKILHGKRQEETGFHY
jgi:acyl-coenzyme A thioesterase PaaI-like protein